MSYIYMEHPFLMFLDHTQRRSTISAEVMQDGLQFCDFVCGVVVCKL